MKKKYNYIKRIRNCIIASMLSAGLILTSLTPLEVFAGTKATTPMKPWRYVKKTANYEVNSTSKKYKDIWTSATNKWCDKGFKWTKKDSSNTKLSSYYDDSKQGLQVAGKCETSYRISDGHINKNKVWLNRAALDKYNYTTAERVCVAEHELGHALGLAHNNKGSVSVMNPANRGDNIKDCDVKGMNKRYSTKISNDVIDPNAEVTVTEYFYVVKPKLKKIKVKYDKEADKIVISGKVKRAKKVVSKYNGVKKTVKVNAKNKFTIEYKYSAAKKITLYGVNNKNEKITKKKSIESEKYVTKTPICRKIIHDKKGITYELDTVAGAILTVKNKGKVISKEVVDSSFSKFFISSESLKRMSGKISFTQEVTGKKVSKEASYKIIDKGSVYAQTY